MKAKFSKKRALIIFVLAIILLVSFNSQSVQVSRQDAAYLQLFLRDWHLQLSPEQVHKNFDTELAFISTVHDSIIAEIRHEEIPHAFFGDVSYYYLNRKGFCYDRSVLMEKMLAYYHFPFRHIYVYFGEGNHTPGPFSFFNKQLPSHAITEVKTSKGWMLMGSNSNWLGIDSSGQLLTLRRFKKELEAHQLNLMKKNSIGLAPFWTGKHGFRFVYGVYSRHGDFFSHQDRNLSVASMQRSFHLLPDYNLKMVFYNFFD